MRVTKDSKLFKISLLSIGLVSALAQAVSGVFPQMYNVFKNISKSNIELLGTIPNFGMIAGLIISPMLIKKSSKKTIILIGLIGEVFTGTVPIYSNSYILILLSRILYGFFTGLFGALAISIISDYYVGNTRSTLIGFENAMGSIGSGICSLLLGSLLLIGWHAAFLIYLLPIIAIVLFGLFIPNDKQVEENDNTAVNKEKVGLKNLSGEVWLIAILEFIFFIILVPMSYKLPQLVVSEHLGTAGDASNIYALFTLIGIPVSLVFGWLHKKLKFNLYIVCLISLAIGYFILCNFHSLVMFYVAGIFNGFGFGTAVPFANNWLAEASEPESINLATTLGMLATNIGVFLSPIIMNGISGSLLDGSARSVMFLSLCGFIMMVVITIFISIRKKRI